MRLVIELPSHLGLVNNPGLVLVKKDAEVLGKEKKKKRRGAIKEVRQVEVEMHDFFNFLMERYQEK